MANGNLRVVAHVYSKPDRIDETRELLIGLIEPTRAEAGCITYELHRNAADRTDFTFIEEWTGDAALDAHLTTPHIQNALSRFDELLTQPPDIRRYMLVG